MTASLVLLSNHAQDRKFCELLAHEAGVGFQPAEKPVDLVKAIESANPAALFIADEHHIDVTKAFQEAFGLFSDKVNPNRVHFLSSQDLAESAAVLNSPFFGSYVSRGSTSPESAAKRYSHVIRASMRDRAFTLKSLMDEKSKIQVIKFSKTSQKQEGVEAVKNFLLALKFKSRMATVVANAVDELVMNAMFDAPADDFGSPLFMSTPRDTVMDLEGRRAVEMVVGYDGSTVGIMAIDLFGSLDKKKLIAHISKRYTEEEYKVKRNMAGAGIGLATVFRSGGSFFFCCEKAEKTEVTVFFQRTDNFREFKDQFRFISTQFYY